MNGNWFCQHALMQSHFYYQESSCRHVSFVLTVVGSACTVSFMNWLVQHALIQSHIYCQESSGRDVSCGTVIQSDSVTKNVQAAMSVL